MSAPVLTETDGPIGRITLNRPDAMNAITVGLATALEAAVRDLAASCRVLVIRGAGGNFCVGGDFQEVERLRGEGPAALAELFAAFGRACAAVGEVDVPVVAAVEGFAMAGGFELAQASDIVVARADAKLADNHARFGMVPGGGGSQYLPRLVGRQRATAHILTGDRLSGADALAWGLAYKAPAAEDFDRVVEDLLAQLAKGSPPARARMKRLIRQGLEMSLADGLEMERRVVVEHIAGEAGGEGVASFGGGGSSAG